MRKRRGAVAVIPPLPTTIWSALGPIPIEIVAELKSAKGEEALGIWDGEHRIIKIRAGMPLVTQWQALRHEQIHQVLWDAGFTEVIAESLEEQVCDLIATNRIAEMVHSVAN